VAGMHIQETPAPLPENILSFINSAERGFIYFSLGSMVKAGNLIDDEKRRSIIKALSKRKEKVILQWSGSDISSEIDHKKFLVSNWLPQQSILAHPKSRCFVTHGGISGHQEAIYFGVPTITLPLFLDQRKIARKSEYLGLGVSMRLSNLTESSFSWALDEVLDKEKYSRNAKELSFRFRDKPQKPTELAKYYVEYVIRHKGADFMRSHIKDKSLIELENIDVYCVIILLVVFIIVLNLKVLQIILATRQKEKLE
jgi:glucuronosyltransferase